MTNFEPKLAKNDKNWLRNRQFLTENYYFRTKIFSSFSTKSYIKMQSPTEREKIFTQRVLSGGEIQRFDLTNIVDQWNGKENNFGLQIEIENGSSDHFRYVILYDSTR